MPDLFQPEVPIYKQRVRFIVFTTVKGCLYVSKMIRHRCTRASTCPFCMVQRMFDENTQPGDVLHLFNVCDVEIVETMKDASKMLQREISRIVNGSSEYQHAGIFAEKGEIQGEELKMVFGKFVLGSN